MGAEHLRNEALDALAEELYGEEAPKTKPTPIEEDYDKRYKRWRKELTGKILNPTQRKFFENDRAKYFLLHAERASGKTICTLHRLVDHCWLNVNALAIIIVGVKRQAEEGGAWYKLQSIVLPQWKRGLGFDESITFATDQKTNTAKDIFIWVLNRHGGWSRILLLSMPVEGFVKDRVKGLEPSFVMVDEAQGLRDPTYFTDIVQQIGRRPNIATGQPIVYCANPDGPSHWLYTRFWIHPIDKETGKWNDDYCCLHVPVQENVHNLEPGYWDRVVEATKGDPVEEARMLRGEWIDRPSGDAIFKDYFSEQFHVRGDAAKNSGLLPVKGFPLVFGYDLGARHSSVTVCQIIPTQDKMLKLVVDEVDAVGQYTPYHVLVPKIVDRMKYWEDRMETQFEFEHISDDSAFNQFRPSAGTSFDYLEVERLSREYVEKSNLPLRYIIRMKAAPKGRGSVEARVRMVRDYLFKEELKVSATCVGACEMFRNLEEDPHKPLQPLRSNNIHRFDSLSYGLFYFDKGRGHMRVTTGTIEPTSYRMSA